MIAFLTLIVLLAVLAVVWVQGNRATRRDEDVRARLRLIADRLESLQREREEIRAKVMERLSAPVGEGRALLRERLRQRQEATK